MIDLVRGLLDRPLDPRHARAIVVIASCLTLVFAGLVASGVVVGPRSTGPDGSRSQTAGPGRPTAPPPTSVVSPATRPKTDGPQAEPRQDPQDRRGTGAYRRARRSLRAHSALQRLAYRHGGLSISLVGADEGRAVVRVEAATKAEGLHRWDRFLRRSGDDGSAYRVRFVPRSRSIPARHGAAR